VSRFARALGIERRVFNVPINGFSEYRKCLLYKEAYEKFFGKSVQYSLLLDRDYYPEEYLDSIKTELAEQNIRVVFTPCKEIENLLLDRALLISILPQEKRAGFTSFLDDLFQAEYDECLSSFIELQTQYSLDKKRATKTVMLSQKPKFDSAWRDPENRLKLIAGKNALAKIRAYLKNLGIRLPSQKLIDGLAQSENSSFYRAFVTEIYQL